MIQASDFLCTPPSVVGGAVGLSLSRAGPRVHACGRGASGCHSGWTVAMQDVQGGGGSSTSLPAGRGGVLWGESGGAVTDWVDSRGALSLICRTAAGAYTRGEQEREEKTADG